MQEEKKLNNQPAAAESSGEARKSDAALREERILEFWRENKIFEKSLEKKAPKGHYVFYDGPPFATGQIHYGHILGSTAKDVIGRYKTMQGYYVPRKWGWDCHGLPIENIVEKELGIAGHKEIEKYGIDKFVEYARSKVLQYDKDWEKGIERIGRWVDFRGSYKTMDNTFIESVWWALSEFNKKNLIYEGVRVLAYCARCETPIANSEIAMDNSYKDISDISVYVKFELVDEPGTYLLAWTTTPWTLPGNTAIAINKDIEYVKISILDPQKASERKIELIKLILAKKVYDDLYSADNKNPLKLAFGLVSAYDEKLKDISTTEYLKGEELIGKKYKPIFPYYKNSEVAKNKNIWKVWHADFVTIEKGTGIAHEAPAFGEDDMNLAKQNDIPWIIHIDETGRFKNEITNFVGIQVKPKSGEKDGHQKADIEVIKYLAKNNSLFAKEKIIHSYPHCMRCETPIIYYALPSWFINIQKVKENIIKQAENINWIPAHLKEGRFKNIVENAPDWNISRNRYWASPLPIWKCEKCKKQTFINSLGDLKEKSVNSDLPVNKNGELDLHRPYIDKIKLKCVCGGEMTRIPEVLDCWFESGSMPFAQDHYPFENKNWQKNNFPAGFVAEYIAQTRTWFYYTHVVSAILFNHTPFKNIVTTGTLRAEDGEKMSKSKNNYPDPWVFIDKYGVDALRIYLMSSTLMKGEDANFSEKAVQDISSKIIGRLFNVLAFYDLYRDKNTESNDVSKSDNILDKWILLRLYQMLSEITKGMENYDMTEATRPIDLFVDDLSTWYLRRSRERIKGNDKDAKQTLYFVLKTLAKVLAPFAPLTAEDIWLKLRNEDDRESVHLENWPLPLRQDLSGSENILKNMEEIRNIVTLGLEARQKAKIQVRQPLSVLEVKNFSLNEEYAELIKNEINVKEIVENKNIESEVLLDTKITPELKIEGEYRELVRALQEMRKSLKLTPKDLVTFVFEAGDIVRELVEKFEAEMKKTVLASKIEFKANDGVEIKIGKLSLKVKIEK